MGRNRKKKVETKAKAVVLKCMDVGMEGSEEMLYKMLEKAKKACKENEIKKLNVVCWRKANK